MFLPDCIKCGLQMIGQPLPSQILPKSGPPATTVDLSVGDRWQLCYVRKHIMQVC